MTQLRTIPVKVRYGNVVWLILRMVKRILGSDERFMKGKG